MSKEKFKQWLLESTPPDRVSLESTILDFMGLSRTSANGWLEELKQFLLLDFNPYLAAKNKMDSNGNGNGRQYNERESEKSRIYEYLVNYYSVLWQEVCEQYDPEKHPEVVTKLHEQAETMELDDIYAFLNYCIQHPIEDPTQILRENT